MEQTIKNIWNDQQVQNGLAVVGFTIIVYCSLKLIYGIIKGKKDFQLSVMIFSNNYFSLTNATISI